MPTNAGSAGAWSTSLVKSQEDADSVSLTGNIVCRPGTPESVVRGNLDDEVLMVSVVVGDD